MNTNMTGFRSFKKKSLPPCALGESSDTAFEELTTSQH